MMHDKNKGAVGIILSKMKPDGSESQGPMKPEEDMSEDADLHSIAEDMLMAMEQKSASGLVDALKAFSACMEAKDAEQDSSMEQGE